MASTVWVNGQFVPEGQPGVSVNDHGLTVGDGVFETCKVVDGVPFALTRHLRRLDRSAGLLGLRQPEDVAVRSAIAATLDAAGPLTLGRLRITLTAGPGPFGSDRCSSPATLMVAVSSGTPWPSRIAAVTVPWTRNEHSAVAGAKTTSYAENVVALQEAHRRGAHEALFANTRGMLCEGTGSNVLVAMGDRLVTPPLSSGCLAGITRELLLEWAAQDGLPIEEAELPLTVLDEAEDVLLTSSTRDVQPVSELNGRALAGGDLGRAAVRVFARHAAEKVDP